MSRRWYLSKEVTTHKIRSHYTLDGRMASIALHSSCARQDIHKGERGARTAMRRLAEVRSQRCSTASRDFLQTR